MRISDWSSDVCSSDLKDATGGEVRYPIIGDHDLNVAKLYGMLPAGEAGTSEGRTAATNQTVRTVFLIGPDKLIKALLLYPLSRGRNFDEVLRQLGSASWRERVCPYGEISVGGE